MPSSMNYGLLVSAILQQNDSSGDWFPTLRKTARIGYKLTQEC
jgi:hypothetical protein